MGADGDAMRLAVADGDTQAIAAHCLDMLGPLVDQRHVLASVHQVRGNATAVGAGAEDGDPEGSTGHLLALHV
jgi:hypothetical protein